MNAETGDRPNGKGNIPMLDLSARFWRDTRVLWRQRDPADQPGEILLRYGITLLDAEQSPPAANYGDYKERLTNGEKLAIVRGWKNSSNPFQTTHQRSSSSVGLNS